MLFVEIKKLKQSKRFKFNILLINQCLVSRVLVQQGLRNYIGCQVVTVVTDGVWCGFGGKVIIVWIWV